MLQVWTRDGVKLFEKQLDKPISNWNLTKDKFLFQIEPHSRDVYLVNLFR